jgi:peptidoglycan/xylan/chitin deacetylase (PgdA/CDA1 family)
VLARLVESQEGEPGILSSERSFAPPIGSNVGSPEHPRGYHIDFRLKAAKPAWPPPWFPSEDQELHVATIQWALGAWERYVAGEGEEWRAAALAAAEHLLMRQVKEGLTEGALLHWFALPHTYILQPPWISAIAQGEAASLFARLHAETQEERFAEAALRALQPMVLPKEKGGVLVELEGGLPFFEEYPTRPDSLVLNGAIFALWGFHDTARALGDSKSSDWFDGGIQGLLRLLPRYDTGYWSRYGLYPHPVANVASSAYHLLHINQLEVLEKMHPNQEIQRLRQRFEHYRRSPRNRAKAFVNKFAFRVVVPRNRLVAHRLPWNERVRRRNGCQDLVVLCFHSISGSWRSSLSVSPKQLREQVQLMLDSGYLPTTFTRAVLGPRPEKTFAVTFDDAFRSVATLAKPVLDELGVPATVFAPTKFIGKSEPVTWPGLDEATRGADEEELCPMTWDQLRSLADAGWEIGSHGHGHFHLPELTDPELFADLRRSRYECEGQMRRPCLSVAYPYGGYDRRVVRRAAAAGYVAAAALPPPFIEETILAWPRIGVYRVDRSWRLRLKISPTVRKIRRSRLGPLFGRLARSTHRETGVPS